MAKRICDPTSGKIGNQVYQNSRNGQVVRTRAIPTNPKSTQQVEARDNLTAAAIAYDALTEAQQNAWIAAAGEVMSQSRLGMSGTLTGLQYYVKVNAALLEIGEAQVDDPPATPTFDDADLGAMTCVNTGGTNVLKVAAGNDLGLNTQVFAAAPVNSGVRRQPDLVNLGPAPTVSGGFTTFSALYVARFGQPAVGKRIHARLVQQVNGLYGPAHNVTCLVTSGS